MHRNLLILGACFGLPARCGALNERGARRLQDGGSIDGAFALQLQQQEGERDENVLKVRSASKLSFVITGIDYMSLAASIMAVQSLSTKVSDSVCGTILLPAANCQVTLSASPSRRLSGDTPVIGIDPSVGVVGGSILVDVSIAPNSQDAETITTEIGAKKDTITSSLLLSAIADVRIMAHENGDAITTRDFTVSTSSANATPSADAIHDVASASDDPHLVGVTGKKFDVNMPGSYVLLRAPSDQRLPAKLELSATLRPSAGGSCGLYIKSVELVGEWLGGQVLGVVPLQRNAEGQNGAGNNTLQPFSVRVQVHQQGPSRAASGEFEQWSDLGKEGRSLSGRVRLVPEWRQVYADAGRTQEAQAFQIQIRGDGAGHDVTLEVAQAAHQALNVRAAGLRGLGFEELGGLLGTEEHDRRLEQVTDECKAFKRKSRVRPESSSMVASWDALP